MSLLLIALAFIGTPVHQTIGVYQGWAAFRDEAEPRCYAIAAPVNKGGKGAAFASVGTWPRHHRRNSFYASLSRVPTIAGRLTVSVGERRFELVARGANAWATDSDSDRAIVSAMREGRSMSIEGVGTGGRPFADTYALAGAATAIDAAALACLRR